MFCLSFYNVIFLQFIYSSREDEITKKSPREVKIRKITIRVDNKSKKKMSS